ncbi:flagellar protein FliT [Methylophaga thiooxydans]|uniref:flagellar protein FliT n=1 Tax=Methylophaga thiooxydans TaxID=392484 RepID=UPI002355594E|nr:flagellar protein FliT [Methylophaga thiooxydans]
MSDTDIINQTIQLTLQSIAFAEQAEWEQLQQNEATRQAMITSLNNLDFDDNDAGSMRHQITQLIDLNETLSALCVAERDKMAVEIKHINKGKKATSAYMK